jgi:hypothetical protein
MYKQTMSFVKGIGTGMVAGMAVATVGSKMMKQDKHMKRNAHKAIRTMGSVLDNIEVMFR